MAPKLHTVETLGLSKNLRIVRILGKTLLSKVLTSQLSNGGLNLKRTVEEWRTHSAMNSRFLRMTGMGIISSTSRRITLILNILKIKWILTSKIFRASSFVRVCLKYSGWSQAQPKPQFTQFNPQPEYPKQGYGMPEGQMTDLNEPPLLEGKNPPSSPMKFPNCTNLIIEKFHFVLLCFLVTSIEFHNCVFRFGN